MPKARFVLASASPRRLALLKQVGHAPDAIHPSNVDESPERGELPRLYAARLALAKAKAAAAVYRDCVILGADTVVACGRRILPKTETEGEVRACLDLLSGRRHRVYGGIAVIGADGRTWTRMVVTHVRIARLSESAIDAYVAGGEWRGKAGGYAIQGAAAAFVPWINGSYTNVVGLCVHEASKLLAAARQSP